MYVCMLVEMGKTEFVCRTEEEERVIISRSKKLIIRMQRDTDREQIMDSPMKPSQHPCFQFLPSIVLLLESLRNTETQNHHIIVSSPPPLFA